MARERAARGRAGRRLTRRRPVSGFSQRGIAMQTITGRSGCRRGGYLTPGGCRGTLRVPRPTRFAGQDYIEGRTAFTEKRKPVFQGR